MLPCVTESTASRLSGMRLSWFLPLAIALACMAAASTTSSPESKLVDSMHAYYVKQFENLSGVKDGKFGTARIESSQITAHTRDGGDPGYDPQGFQTTVLIYGAHGKALRPTDLKLRYRRLPGPVHQGERVVDSSLYAMSIVPDAELVKNAVTQWAQDGGKPYVASPGGVYWEARPVRLSKTECLKCHVGMKQGDPVAVMVYRVLPKVKK